MTIRLKCKAKTDAEFSREVYAGGQPLSLDEIIKRNGNTLSIRRTSFNFNVDFALDSFQKIGNAILAPFNKPYVIDKRNKWPITQLIRWLEGDKGMQAVSSKNKTEIIAGDLSKGLYIAGGTGTGKTLAVYILNELSDIDYVPIELGGITVRLKWSAVRAADICEDFSRTGNLDKWKRMKILCVNDLGSEQSETLYMGTRVQVMREILEYRGDELGTITVITSNVPIEDLAKCYGDRAASRINSMCNYIIMRGDDRRKL